MPTLREHVDKVIEKIANFHPSDDLDVPEEFIIGKLNDVRASLIREKVRKKESIDEFYEFDCCHQLQCLKRTCIIGGVTFQADGTLFYVKNTNIIRSLDNRAVKYVGSEEGQAYSRLNLYAFNRTSDLRHANTLPAWTVIDDKIWVKNPESDGQIFVCVASIPYDPRTKCDPKGVDIEYEVPSEYRLELMVAKDILSTMGITHDVKSDLNDDRISTTDEAIQGQNSSED